MAVRSDELTFDASAVVYRFPTARVRARAVRQRRAEIRRRRLALVLVTIGMVLVTLVATGPAGLAPASRPGAPATVRIAPGDTLWDLATLYAPPGMDPRAYVDAILEVNGLTGMPTAGSTIKLPG
jgi:LysM domain